MEVGDLVKLVQQSEAHLTGGRPVKIGTLGRVKATRIDSGVEQLLVKFDGHGTPRHTSIEAVLRWK